MTKLLIFLGYILVGIVLYWRYEGDLNSEAPTVAAGAWAFGLLMLCGFLGANP